MNIVYNDDNLVLVEKPVGLSSQEVSGGDSLPKRLAESGLPVKPIHRLDRDTGGIMVYARTQKDAAKLSTMIGQHDRFVKEYLAVVTGKPTEDEGTLEDLLYHDVRKNKSFVVKRMRKGVRLARLSYTLLGTITVAEGTFSLVRVRLHTGRTHQIRVQFASRGLPLAGDCRYGGYRGVCMGLWSHSLSFPHPTTGQVVFGTSEPPWSQPPWRWFAEDCKRDSL